MFGCLALPLVENERRATRGSSWNMSLYDYAVDNVMSISCFVVGAITIPQSANSIGGMPSFAIMKKEEEVLTPSAVPMFLRAARMTSVLVATDPATMPSHFFWLRF